MKKRIYLLISVFILSFTYIWAGNRITARQFGAFPNDGKDDTEALRQAAVYVRSHPGTTLLLEKGDYLLSDPEAEKLEQAVLQGEYGQDPEKKMFVPYHSYVKGLDFSGATDANVEAKGARLLLSGWMEPISIEQCNNFVLKGLDIDYVRKPMSEGRVTEIRENSFTVEFSIRPCALTEQTPFPRVVLWDSRVKAIYGALYFCKEKVLNDSTVMFRGKLPKELVGTRTSVPHSFHYRPAIFINESCNVTLCDVTIRSQCGMGVVGFHSGNVLMKRLHVIPPKGQHFSTNTDATHFASCWGTLEFDHCEFYGQGDDATNVHGYYHEFKAEGNKAEVWLDAPTFTHAQLADVPRVGDVMALVRIVDLLPIHDYQVTSVEHADKATTFTLTTDSLLPEQADAYYLINKTLMPKLLFHHCSDANHLARGVLVKTTGGCKIHHNTFKGLNLPGIVLSSEADWKEGWHTANATIHHNRITHCGNKSYEGAGIAIDLKCEDASQMLHDNIDIYHNIVEAYNNNACGILIKNAKSIRLRNNTVRGCQEEVHQSCAEVSIQ